MGLYKSPFDIRDYDLYSDLFEGMERMYMPSFIKERFKLGVQNGLLIIIGSKRTRYVIDDGAAFGLPICTARPHNYWIVINETSLIEHGLLRNDGSPIRGEFQSIFDKEIYDKFPLKDDKIRFFRPDDKPFIYPRMVVEEFPDEEKDFKERVTARVAIGVLAQRNVVPFEMTCLGFAPSFCSDLVKIVCRGFAYTQTLSGWGGIAHTRTLPTPCLWV